MPRLNQTGDIACGIGEGVASILTVIDGRLVRRFELSGAGGAEWLDDHRIIVQHCSDRCRLLTSFGEVLSEQGASQIVAGGGRWFAWLAGVGTRDAVGLVPIHYPLAMGADGSLAYKTSEAGGVTLRWPDGSERQLSQGIAADFSVQILAPDEVSWLEGVTPRAFGLPVPVTVPGRVDWLRRDAGWSLYQDERGRLLLQPDHEPIGHVVAQGNCFRPDLRMLPNGRLRVVWSTTQGEHPSTVFFRDYALTELREDLRVTMPPPPPNPQPDPEPPGPHPMRLPDHIFATLKEVRSKYPTPLGDQGAALLNEVAWIHRAEGYGLESKGGGNTCGQPTTGTRCGCDILRTRDLGWDVLGDAEGVAEPQQADSGPADPARFVAPVHPTGQPHPDPDPEPEPPPPSGALEARVLELEKRLTALEQVEYSIALVRK